MIKYILRLEKPDNPGDIIQRRFIVGGIKIGNEQHIQVQEDGRLLKSEVGRTHVVILGARNPLLLDIDQPHYDVVFQPVGKRIIKLRNTPESDDGFGGIILSFYTKVMSQVIIYN